MLRFTAKRGLGLGFHETQSPATQVLPRIYHERVVDHYNSPRNIGSFEKNDRTVGTGLVGAPACGDVMKLQIKVDEESGKIVDACFKTFGCGSAIASSSVGIALQPTRFIRIPHNRGCSSHLLTVLLMFLGV